MAPKAITSDLFKNRKEVNKEIIEKLLVKGGPVAIKESLKQFGYKDNEKVAVPTIVVAGDGRIRGDQVDSLGQSQQEGHHQGKPAVARGGGRGMHQLGGARV